MRPAAEQQMTFGRGLNTTAAPTEYRRDEVAVLLNGRVSYDGNAIGRRDGTQKLHASALNSGATGYGGKEFVTAAGVVQLCVFVGDKFYYSDDDGVTWTNPAGATSLTTAYWSMVTMRVGSDNLLICANGSTNIYKWDGSTWGTLSNEPSGAKYLAVFNGRLYAAGHSGNTVAASKVWDPDTWGVPDGFQVEVDTHDGDNEITGLFQLGSFLLAFKRGSTSYLEGFGYETINVEAGARGMSRSVGCMAHRSIAPIGNDGVCWMSERGFEFFSLAGGAIELVSRPIQQFIDSISWTSIKDSQGLPSATFWPNRNEYMCAFPSATGQNDYIFRWRPPTLESAPSIALDIVADSTTPSYTVYIDTDGYLVVETDASRQQARVSGGYLRVAASGEPGRYVTVDSDGYMDVAQVDAMAASLFAADYDTGGIIQGPFGVGYDGYVRKMEYGDTDDADSDGTSGVPIGLRVRSRPFLFRDQFRKKKARVIRITTRQEEAVTVNGKIVVDGATGTSHTFSMPASSDMPVPKKARITGRGHAFQVEIDSSDKVELAGVEVLADLLTEPF